MARYTMRQRLVSIGEDLDVANEHGNPVFRVDGKVMRLRDTFVLEDLQGREVATIREKKLALRLQTAPCLHTYGCGASSAFMALLATEKRHQPMAA